jgi:hypothetical protein
MCGFCNVWVCVCMGFVMCGCVLLCVGVCMYGYCNVWVCVCVGFVMCGCVCVCVGFVMCGCFSNCTGVLVNCVLVFTVFLHCFTYVCVFLFVTGVRTTAIE